MTQTALLSVVASLSFDGINLKGANVSPNNGAAAVRLGIAVCCGAARIGGW